MTQPIIDLTIPNAIRRELSHDDAAARTDFAAHLDERLTGLSRTPAACFRLLPALNEAANRAQTICIALVAAFAIDVLDNISCRRNC
ncbi:MAG TPA: hypothetical protein VGN12_17655 [Pirellulales bacterium]|jgi:hypothetical protein